MWVGMYFMALSEYTWIQPFYIVLSQILKYVLYV